MSLKSKLQRMKGHLSLESDKSTEAEQEKPELSKEAEEVSGAESVESHQTSEEALPQLAAELSDAATEPEIPYAERWKSMQAAPFLWEDEHVMIREVPIHYVSSMGGTALLSCTRRSQPGKRPASSIRCLQRDGGRRICCFLTRKRLGCQGEREIPCFC